MCSIKQLCFYDECCLHDFSVFYMLTFCFIIVMFLFVYVINEYQLKHKQHYYTVVPTTAESRCIWLIEYYFTMNVGWINLFKFHIDNLMLYSFIVIIWVCDIWIYNEAGTTPHQGIVKTTSATVRSYWYLVFNTRYISVQLLL